MNPAHIHLLLNHVSPIGVPIGLVILLVGLLRHNETLVRASLVLFAALAIITIPIHLTGEPAEEVAEGLPGVTDVVIEEHEDAAFIALISTLALGVGSIAGLLLMRRNRPLSGAIGYGIVALAVLSTGTLTWVAELGGKVRHTEIRSGAPTGVAEPGQGEQEGESD